MGHRLTKIYTKTGDSGTTGLADGSRISKSAIDIHLFGELDELNAYIGLVNASINNFFETDEWYNHKEELNCTKIRSVLYEIQDLLFDMGGDICIQGRNSITNDHIIYLENTLDYFNDNLPPLKDFILPGGNLMSSHCHVARTICRRVERSIVSYNKQKLVDNGINLMFLNRLSDLLFVFARVLARVDGQEVLWNQNREKHGPEK